MQQPPIENARAQRTKLVIGVFGVALGVTLGGLLLLEGANARLGTAILSLPLFPAGLWRWFPTPGNPVQPLIGWIVYFGLGLVIVKARGRWTRITSLALFLLLLCLNVAGCWPEVRAPIVE